jgi:hypothetical protein
LCLVSGFGGVVATLGEAPSDLVRNPLLEVDASKLCPQGNILADMLQSESRVHVDLGDPTVVVQGHFDVPMLPSGDVIDERGNVERF